MAMPEFKPLVSVVMVAYNHARYLRETISSVLKQSLAELELILIDNGSSDNSAEIIAEFDDPRIIKIRQENLGLSLAYNIGIERSSAPFIACGNADDVWMPEKLEEQLKAIEKTGAGVSFTAARLIDDHGNAVPEEIAAKFPFSFENLARAQMYEKFFFKSNFLCATSALISKDLLLEQAFKAELIQLQDFELWIRLVKKSSFLVLPQQLVGYRIRMDGQNLSLDSSNRARVLFELNCVYRNFFENVDPAFFRDAFANHLRKADFSGEIGMQFEQAFLFLKMQEPSIRVLGVELLYRLMNFEEGRRIAERDYAFRITDLWSLCKVPFYADSQSVDAAVLDYSDMALRLKESEAELDRLRRTMDELSNSKFWKLKSKIADIFNRH
ncbi:MAG: glycosyltransferase [Candidatus Obscuribacterales bacterium]|nr:glycosyltransferase [Candidatus Obscuribacterales bacterium]